MEQIDYSSLAPWPAGAAGTGSSLQRQMAHSYGNDPTNWFVATPTAAGPNATNPSDADGDGLPDAWEIQYFGSISDPRATPDADPDGDGFTNAQEYLAGTSPVDASSALKLDSATVAGVTTTLHFNAIAGKTYSVLYRDDVANGLWLKLRDVPAQGGSGSVAVIDPNSGATVTRFYRLVTPLQP